MRGEGDRVGDSSRMVRKNEGFADLLVDGTDGEKYNAHDYEQNCEGMRGTVSA